MLFHTMAKLAAPSTSGFRAMVENDYVKPLKVPGNHFKHKTAFLVSSLIRGSNINPVLNGQT